MTITFETKVWENDWRFILQGNRLREVIQRCHHTFDKKIIYINNVRDINEVCRHADKLINQSIIDSWVDVSKYSEETLDYFQLSKESLGRGYYYSIAELVSIYLCKTDYLLHFASDSWTEKNKDHIFISKMIDLLRDHPEIVVCNLAWNKRYDEVMHESIKQLAEFSISQGFSDQMYLIRVADFKNQIYNETNEGSNHYPEYGGELFEKRVHSWMLNQNKFRATYKNLSYIHKNFSKPSWKRPLEYIKNKLAFF